MKKELTREEVAALANCNVVNSQDCKTCQAIKICDSTSEAICKWLAEQLLEEMDKPKVWDGSPENAHTAMVVWYGEDGSTTNTQDFTREIPKTRARQIAEEVISENVGGVEDKVSLLTDLIETALEKYEAELKGEA